MATFSAADEDPGQLLSYAVAGTDKAKFKLQGNSLMIEEIPDYETKSTYTVMVTLSDNGHPKLQVSTFILSLSCLSWLIAVPLQATRTFVLTVLNTNEPPFGLAFTNVNGQQKFSVGKPSVNENSKKSTVVGTVTVSDFDRGETIAMSLDDDAGGLFRLDGQTSCAAKTTNTVCPIMSPGL